VRLDQLEGMGIFAVRAVVLGEPDARARRRQPLHRPGVRAEPSDLAAVLQHGIEQEALVAADEPGWDEGRIEDHASRSSASGAGPQRGRSGGKATAKPWPAHKSPAHPLWR